MACGVDNFFFGCLQAVEFVNMQHDDELWEELIKQCLNKPEMVYITYFTRQFCKYLQYDAKFSWACFHQRAGWCVVGAHCWQSRSSIYRKYGAQWLRDSSVSIDWIFFFGCSLVYFLFYALWSRSFVDWVMHIVIIWLGVGNNTTRKFGIALLHFYNFCVWYVSVWEIAWWKLLLITGLKHLLDMGAMTFWRFSDITF